MISKLKILLTQKKKRVQKRNFHKIFKPVTDKQTAKPMYKWLIATMKYMGTYE